MITFAPPLVPINTLRFHCDYIYIHTIIRKITIVFQCCEQHFKFDHGSLELEEASPLMLLCGGLILYPTQSNNISTSPGNSDNYE